MLTVLNRVRKYYLLIIGCKIDNYNCITIFVFVYIMKISQTRAEN